MNILVSFDEIKERLHEFDESLLQHDYKHSPVLRAISHALVYMKWEGTPLMLSDAFMQERDELESFAHTMTRLGYHVQTEHGVSINQIQQKEFPLYIEGKAGGSILLSIKDGKASFYDYHADIMVERNFDEDERLTICYVTAYSRIFREPPPETMDKTNWIKHCFYRQKPVFKKLVRLSFVINILGALVPFFIMSVYRFALPAESVSTLLWLCLGGATIGLLEFNFRKIRMDVLSEAGKDMAAYISYHVTSKLLWLAYSMTSSAGVSSQLARLKDIDQFRKLLTADSTLSYFDLPFIIIFIIAIMMLSGAAALVVVIGIIIMLVFCFFARMRYQQAVEQNSRASAQLQYQWNDLLHNLQFIQGLPLMRILHSRFMVAHAQSANDSEGVNLTNGEIQQAGNMMIQIIGLSSIVAAVFFMLEGESDIGAMMATIILAWKALTPVMGIYNAVLRFKTIKNSSAQINALMALNDDRARVNKSPPIDRFLGRLEIKAISHRHAGAVKGLTNIDVKINPGEVISVTGAAGCGKTTLLHIIAGLQEQYQGAVFCDGYNIRQFNSFRYRQAIKYVPFDVHFFDGTVEDNFYLYNGEMTYVEMTELLDIFKLQDYLPNGLETPLNNMTVQQMPSSVVQSLKLAIGIGDCKEGVVLLDEPMLACSPELIRQLTILLNEKLKHKTIVMVTTQREVISMSQKCLLLDADGGQKFFGHVSKVLEVM